MLFGRIKQLIKIKCEKYRRRIQSHIHFAPVFIFTSGSSGLLGRPRCGLSIWLSQLPIFNTLFWVYANLFHEKTDKTRKYSKIRKWPPTFTRRAKHYTERTSISKCENCLRTEEQHKPQQWALLPPKTGHTQCRWWYPGQACVLQSSVKKTDVPKVQL